MYRSDLETTHLRHIVELEWRLKVFQSSIFILFWISLYRGTPSCYLFLKFRCCMLAHMMKEIHLYSATCFCMRYKTVFFHVFFQQMRPNRCEKFKKFKKFQNFKEKFKTSRRMSLKNRFKVQERDLHLRKKSWISKV